MTPSETFKKRRAASEDVVRTLERHVVKELKDEDKAIEGTTIFVTGSAARGEMSSHSDIDLFVVRLLGAHSELDSAVITTTIYRSLRAMGKPPPSQDGRFLKMQLASALVGELGTDRDDFYNHFTARMLLLLESKPLIADDQRYDSLISQVLDRYWKDAEVHAGDHIPYLLVNDVIRYWRILLLNYAAKVGGHGTDEGERRLASYKLRFSRCLLCFSALAYLTAVYRKSRNLQKEVGTALTKLSPLERLDAVSELEPAQVERIAKLRDLYALFLEHTDADKQLLVRRFADIEYRKARSGEARAFGDSIFDLMMALGDGPGREMLRIALV